MTQAASWLPASDMTELLEAVAEASRADAEDDPFIDVDCARIARQVRHSGRSVIGLMPAGPDPRIQPFALQLAFALSRLTQTLTIVLDPEHRAGFSSSQRSAESSALVYVSPAAPGVAVLAPHEVAPVGAKFEMVRVLLHFVEERMKVGGSQRGRPYGHVLADLTGCARPGELLGALALLDGIILVGHAGRTREHDIESATREVPRDLFLGVVLTE